MPKITYAGMPTEEARALQRGGLDANEMACERSVSNGKGNPCRHCLQMIAEGEDMLIFALRPFSTAQPYAEVGPAFLHARECDACLMEDKLPPVLHHSPAYLVRGYDADERIVYGSGKVIANAAIGSRADELFENPDIRFLHVRSASNNCWQARIDRAVETDR